MLRKLDEVSHDDGKRAPGGLEDIEFIDQVCRLKAGYATRTTSMRKLLQELSAVGVLDESAAETLIDCYRVFRKLKLLFACAGVPPHPERAPTMRRTLRS